MPLQNRSPLASLLLASAAWVALSFSAVAARADGSRDLDEAKQFRDRGVEAMHAGRKAEALQWFRRSYARYPSARMRYNLAIVLEELGRPAEAVENYEDFLAADTTDEPAQAYARARIAALESNIARLQLEVTPPSARVWLEKQLVTHIGPPGVPVAPGAMSVEAEESGYVKIALQVSLAPGERRHLKVELRPVPDALEPRHRATVTLAPTRSPALAANAIVEHRTPAKPPLVKRAWFWTALAGGAAVVATGVTLGVVYGKQTLAIPKSSLGDASVHF
jgi:tetratricopeptide (TPR) repeat protein